MIKILVMRLILLAIFLFFASSNSFSQLPVSKVPNDLQKFNNGTSSDTLIRIKPNNNSLKKPFGSKHKMPTLIIDNNGVYERNLGNGLDLYSMTLDKMPCVSPDSTFQSKMAITEFLKSKAKSYQPPKN